MDPRLLPPPQQLPVVAEISRNWGGRGALSRSRTHLLVSANMAQNVTVAQLRAALTPGTGTRAEFQALAKSLTDHELAEMLVKAEIKVPTTWQFRVSHMMGEPVRTAAGDFEKPGRSCEERVSDRTQGYPPGGGPGTSAGPGAGTGPAGERDERPAHDLTPCQ